MTDMQKYSRQVFEEMKQYTDKGVEFWRAREMQKVLDYADWRNFNVVISKAIEACKNSDIVASDHFVEVTEMVEIGSGAKREVESYNLSRYACYLIVQNADPSKEVVAFGQTYFAVQTRKQEVSEDIERLNMRLEARSRLKQSEKQLSKILSERNIDSEGFRNIRSKGDEALFGGINTSEMKKKLGVQENRPLADFLPAVTVAGKYLATEMTNYNVTAREINGEEHITEEHVQNNSSVRDMLVQRGIEPEKLPAEEDIQKIERRVKSIEKKFDKN